MPKKTFKDSAAHLDRFFSDTSGPQETHTPTPAAPPAPKYYRLNLKLKAEYREYLERVSWEAHKSITQYLNDLIEADKATRDT